jgi:hypothetical protein
MPTTTRTTTTTRSGLKVKTHAKAGGGLDHGGGQPNPHDQIILPWDSTNSIYVL